MTLYGGRSGPAADRGPDAAWIYVRPVGGGWCVDCAFDEALMFLSGAQAETQARRLARCLSALGQEAVVEVHDRRDGLVGVIRYAAGPTGHRPPYA